MSDDIKHMDIAEFRARGYLHEVNRLVLHPLGLALEVSVDEATGEERLAGVWDYREESGGIIYGEDSLNPEKAAAVAHEIEDKGPARIDDVGFVIQPLPPEFKQLKVSVLEVSEWTEGGEGD